jgi:hypothetical protein
LHILSSFVVVQFPVMKLINYGKYSNPLEQTLFTTLKVAKNAQIKNVSWGGFHKAIYALHLKFVLCSPSLFHKFTLIWHHAFAPYAQLGLA